jgi:hypothetical protein
MYTAVFLLTSLILFHFSARQSRPKSSFALERATKDATHPSSPHTTDASSKSGDSASSRRSKTATIHRYISDIPEDNAVFVAVEEASLKPFVPESDSASSVRRRRFRFGRRKSTSSPLVNTVGHIKERSRNSAVHPKDDADMITLTKSF